MKENWEVSKDEYLSQLAKWLNILLLSKFIINKNEQIL